MAGRRIKHCKKCWAALVSAHSDSETESKTHHIFPSPNAVEIGSGGAVWSKITHLRIYFHDNHCHGDLDTWSKEARPLYIEGSPTIWAPIQQRVMNFGEIITQEKRARTHPQLALGLQNIHVWCLEMVKIPASKQTSHKCPCIYS